MASLCLEYIQSIKVFVYNTLWPYFAGIPADRRGGHGATMEHENACRNPFLHVC